jgi:cytochrome c553
MSLLSGIRLALIVALPQDASGDGAELFEKSVRPLLVERCLRCHGEDRPKAALRLDSRAGVLAGGKHGPAAIEKRPDESLLVQAVRREGARKMPPSQPLAPEEVAALTRWVELGMPWPDAKPDVGEITDAKDGKDAAHEGAREKLVERDFTPAERAFWSFQPIADPAPPAVHDEAWPSNDLDRFVLAELEARGLSPAPRADRRTLIRRATFDLTGLPPTPEEVAAFETDGASDAFARVVDRLLDSPRYAQRWARHWLDVVRYADSFDARSLVPGAERADAAEAWRYRDWVVDAFARDLPFPDFVQDQIAGDLRAGDGETFDARRIVATGALAIGNWGGGDSDKRKMLTDIADDQVDLVGRAFLGLTIGCARCHDHKFDPITNADYYGLAGIFLSTHILPEVGAPTEGSPVLRIALASATELAERTRRDAREKELAAQVLAAFGGWPLTKVVRDVAGNGDLVALRNEDETPSLLVNHGEARAAAGTLALPPRSIALHPSPAAGVAVAFDAPGDCVVSVKGRVADGDATCGDGIEWTLERMRAGAGERLARGAIDNGGAMELAAGEGGAALDTIELARGDALLLTILPRGGYECDTTVVELVLTDAAPDATPTRTWDLGADVLADVARGGPSNPIAAADGARWRFLDRRASGVSPTQLAALASRANVEIAEGRAPAAVGAALAELAELRAHAPPPLTFANGAQEGGVPNSEHAGVHDVAIHVRGRYDRLGATVPRRFPRILAGDVQPPVGEGSGRRALAEWLADPANPLPPRVYVNRLWQHHFGAGLVRTPGNFGKMGEPPSHPALLDWLARRFLDAGGSTKAMHRLILASSAWQQSATPAPESLAADPDDRWLGRMSRARLDAEQLRDALLATSGELDGTAGGPAPRDPGSLRRTLYVMTVRSDRAGWRTLFDGADPTAIVDVRNQSTVAPQSLWLMNDEFVLARAAALAARVQREAADEPARVARLFELLFARAPDADEAAIAHGLLTRARAAADEATAWEELAHVLVCSNEFFFVD